MPKKLVEHIHFIGQEDIMFANIRIRERLQTCIVWRPSKKLSNRVQWGMKTIRGFEDAIFLGGVEASNAFEYFE
jgi:hypothetical protein